MPFLTGYTLRKKITIDNTYVDGDLTDFPLYVPLAADADIGANIDSNGYNIRFTTSDGETLLKYERQVGFTSAGGTAATGKFWVKVPTIDDAADTDIYIYYKSAAPSDGADPTNVWDGSFAAVYHMEEDPSGSAPQILDSTANNRDGTSAGSMTSGDLVGGQVGNGLDLDSDDYIDVSGMANVLGGNAEFSMSMWFKPTLGADAKGIITNSLDFGLQSSGSTFKRLSVNLRDGVHGGLSPALETGNDALTDGAWNFIAVTVNGNTDIHKLYVAATELATSSATFDTFDTAGDNTFYLGNSGGSVSPGIYDEIRFSLSVRSVAWFKFEYRNMVESDHELTFGAEEADSGGGQPTVKRFGGVQFSHRMGGAGMPTAIRMW